MNRFNYRTPDASKPDELPLRASCQRVHKPASFKLIHLLKAVIGFILPGVAAVLTQGGTVSADSDGTNCLGALIDGIFSSQYGNNEFCMAHNNPTTDGGYLLIELLYPSVVQTVLIINREYTCCADRIKSASLKVGMMSNPIQENACKSDITLLSPNGSGLYYCPDQLKAKFIRLQNKVEDYLNIGEIRAYSQRPDNLAEQSYTFSSSTLDPVCDTTKSIFDWPMLHSGKPVHNIFEQTACIQRLKAQASNSEVFYKVQFPAPRFVHAVTILAHSRNGYDDSDNWIVFCLNQTEETNCGAFSAPNDKYGKENAIGQKLTGIKIKQSANQVLQLFWVGLFTTAYDCSDTVQVPFTWSIPQDWPSVFKLDGSSIIEGQIKATRGDCPIAQWKTSTNQDFVVFYAQQNKLTINQPTSSLQEGQLEIKITAYSNYGTGVHQEEKKLTFTVRQCIYFLKPLIGPLNFEKTGLSLSHELPDPITDPEVDWDPIVSLEKTTNDENSGNVDYFTLSSTDVVVDEAVKKGGYQLHFDFYDAQCDITNKLVIPVTIYECKIKDFAISQSSVSILLASEGGVPKPLSWVSDQLEPLCGGYTITVEASSLSQVQIEEKVLLVSPSQQIGTKTINFTLTREKKPSQTAAASLTVITFSCAPTGLSLRPQNVTVQYRGDRLKVAWSMDEMDSSCGDYSVLIDSQYASLVKVNQRELLVQSLLASEIGDQEITIILAGQNNPSQKIEAKLKVTVYCSIEFLTQPAIFTEVKVGVDIQPIRIPYALDNLQCNAAATFTLSSSEPFISLEGITTSSGNVKIANATGLMHKVYKFTLSALNQYQSITKDFSIYINGCPSTTIERQVIPSVEIFRQSGQQSGQIQFQEFKHSLGSLLAVDCGKFVQKLNMVSGPHPAWISLDSSLIKYDVSSVEKAQTFELNLSVSLQDYPNVDLNQRFNVTVASSEITCNQLTPTEYQISDPPKIVSISYLNQTFASMTKLTKVITPIVTRDGGKKVSPDFIRYADNRFTVFSNKTEDTGTYEIGLSVGYQEFPTQAIQCKVTLTAKFTNEIIGAEIEDQKVSCSAPQSLSLPKYTDKGGQAVQMVVNLGSANQYLVYDESTNTIRSDPKKTEGLNSKFKIEMTLTDLYSNTVTRSFILDVTCPVAIGEQSLKQEKTSTFNQKQKEIKPLVPSIKKISNAGLMRVEFSKPVILPTFSTYPELLVQFECKDPCQRKLQRNETSDMLESIQIMNQAKVLINGTSLPIIDVGIEPGIYSNYTQLAFKWECVEFKHTHMDIQLNFNYSDKVSVYSQRDSIQLIFIGNQYFKTEDGQIIAPQTVTQRSIVPQISQKMAQQVELLANTVVQSSKAVIVLNFILSMVASTSLNTLFGAMNKLQIISHLLLISVPISANAWKFFASLLSLVNFDIVDTEPISRKIFRFGQDKPFTDTFEELGYASRFFIINMGTLLYAFFGFLIGLFLIIMLGKVNHPRAQTLRSKLIKSLVWATFIEYFNESYLSTAVSCFISLPNYTLRPFGQFVSQNLAYIFLLILIFYPIGKLIYLWENRLKLNSPDFKEKYEPAYENLRHKWQRWALLEPFLTDLRRLTLALVLVYSQGFPIFQIATAFLQILIVTIFNGQVEPFATKSTGRLEQFNELVVSVIFYHILCFADLVRDQKVLIEVGWSMIACTSACFLVNFSIVIYQSGKSAITRSKLWRHNRKVKLDAQRRQRIDEGRQRQLFDYYEEQKKEGAETTRPIVVEAAIRRMTLDQTNQNFPLATASFGQDAPNQDFSELEIAQPQLLRAQSQTIFEGNNQTPSIRLNLHIQDSDSTPDHQPNTISPRSQWERRSSFFRTENQPFRTPF